MGGAIGVARRLAGWLHPQSGQLGGHSGCYSDGSFQTFWSFWRSNRWLFIYIDFPENVHVCICCIVGMLIN